MSHSKKKSRPELLTPRPFRQRGHIKEVVVPAGKQDNVPRGEDADEVEGELRAWAPARRVDHWFRPRVGTHRKKH